MNLEMGPRTSLAEITNLNAARSDNDQKFHSLLVISQPNPRRKFRSFQLLRRKADRQQKQHFCWSSDKNLTGCGLPLRNLIIQTCPFQSMQDDLSTERSKNTQEVINLTIKKTSSTINFTTKNKH